MLLNNRSATRYRGFTIIELLVISAASALLLMMAMPGMLQARQRASDVSCKNNLKQLALAMHNYHDTYLTFPPAWSARFLESDSPSWLGWQTAILPYVEQAPLYNQIYSNALIPEWPDLHITLPARRGEKAATLGEFSIPVYLCPQDSTGNTNPFRGGFGTSNYTGNFGSELLPRWFESSSEEYWPGGVATPPENNGIFAVNSSIGLRDITDGTSNTILVSERSALSGAGIWLGVRSNRHENDVITDFHHSSGLNKSYAGASGRHDAKVNVAICDGSVRLISEDIDSNPDGGTLQNLSSRNDGRVIGEF